MSLFTFVSEVASSTVVEQSHGDDVIDAVTRWGRASQLRPKLNEDVIEIDATPVSGVTDVWCISGLTEGGDVFITHIVATHPHLAAVR
jgi:hypothetical protein